MKINFKSVYKLPGDKNENTIEFSSKLERDFEDGYEVLLFNENRNGKNIANRIEYNTDTLKVFSGISSIVCELNKIVKNDFVVEGLESEKFFIYTKMNKINIENDYLLFEYETSASEDFSEDNTTKIKLEFTITKED